MIDKVADKITDIGANGVRIVSSIGRSALMLMGALFHRPQPIKNAHLLIKQLYSWGCNR